MGIEPTQPAWKASVLPLNYTRIFVYFLTTKYIITHTEYFVNTFFEKNQTFLKLFCSKQRSRDFAENAPKFTFTFRGIIIL